MDSEKRKLAQLLADLSRVDATLEQVKEKPRWDEVEIREEKQVMVVVEVVVVVVVVVEEEEEEVVGGNCFLFRFKSHPSVLFVLFSYFFTAEDQTADCNGRAAACVDQ